MITVSVWVAVASLLTLAVFQALLKDALLRFACSKPLLSCIFHTIS